MLQQVIQGGNFGIFTQTALVLFFLAFVAMLVITFFRPRSQTDQYARLPLADDNDTQPITPRTDTVATGAQKQ